VNDRLYRSRDDRVISGVCAGLADRLDLDPSLVRIGWVVLTIATGGLLILLYIVMLIVVPEEPADGAVPPAAPEPGAIPGWTPPGGGTAWNPPAGVAPGAATSATGGETSPSATPQGAPPAGPAPAAGWVPPSASAPYPDSRAGRRAERRAARAERRRNADPVVGLVFGGILVLLGIYFLLQQYLPSLDLGRFWPVIIIGIGVLLVVRAVSRPRPEG
jgi:phage shock protein C